MLISHNINRYFASISYLWYGSLKQGYQDGKPKSVWKFSVKISKTHEKISDHKFLKITDYFKNLLLVFRLDMLILSYHTKGNQISLRNRGRAKIAWNANG